MVLNLTAGLFHVPSLSIALTMPLVGSLGVRCGARMGNSSGTTSRILSQDAEKVGIDIAN